MIKLENVQFNYSKGQNLFQDLSLELECGHIYGLLGKNGAGKTTLMKMMAGMRFPQNGTINTLGYPAFKRNPQMLQDIYFLAEELYLPQLSIQQFIDLYSPFYPNFSMEQMQHYMEEFELDDMKRNLSQMSHGQKRKTMISFALATNTRVLFMDEPTNGLDIPSKTMFRRVMAQAADMGRLFVISTHQVRDLHSLIDGIIILDSGKIVVNALSEDITDKLLFKVLDIDADTEGVIYSEDTLRGIYAILENTNHEESKLDIELFFNAVLSNKQKMNEIFNAKNI